MKELLEYTGWSLQDLANNCNTNKQNLSSIIRGERVPTYPVLEDIITEGFGVSEEEYFRYGEIPKGLKKKKDEK